MLPPGCTEAEPGRTRYVVGTYAANDNTARASGYAPLELYMMGLLPLSELPASFPVLTEAAYVSNSYDEDSDTLVMEAGGLDEILLSDIVARHGERPLTPESERQYAVAFILISEAPVDDAMLQIVSVWAESLGDHMTDPPWPSFTEQTGGRATLTARVQARRTTTQPVPPPTEEFLCDPVAQSCGDGLGCYHLGRWVCSIPGTLTHGELCGDDLCARGLDCFTTASDPNAYACATYCDPDDVTSDIACQTLCPDTFFRLTEQGVVFGICQAD